LKGIEGNWNFSVPPEMTGIEMELTPTLVLSVHLPIIALSRQCCRVDCSGLLAFSPIGVGPFSDFEISIINHVIQINESNVFSFFPGST
jgi:hypothetical protein